MSPAPNDYACAAYLVGLALLVMEDDEATLTSGVLLAVLKAVVGHHLVTLYLRNTLLAQIFQVAKLG